MGSHPANRVHQPFHPRLEANLYPKYFQSILYALHSIFLPTFGKKKVDLGRWSTVRMERSEGITKNSFLRFHMYKYIIMYIHKFCPSLFGMKIWINLDVLAGCENMNLCMLFFPRKDWLSSFLYVLNLRNLWYPQKMKIKIQSLELFFIRPIYFFFLIVFQTFWWKAV